MTPISKSLLLVAIIPTLSIFVIIANPVLAQLDKTNWLTGETDFITFEYPPGWELTLPTSKFDVQDFKLLDPNTRTIILGSTGEVHSEYYQDNPESYYDFYVTNARHSIIGSYKVESYSYGEITIGELPAYSELYSGKFDYLSKEKFGILISMIFYDDNSKRYTIVSGSPVSDYEKMEPVMLEIMKSITLKD